MEVGNLSIPVTADLGPLEKQLQALKRRLGQVEGQTDGVTNAMKGVERQTRSLDGVIGTFAKRLAGIFAVKELIRFTDTWTDLTSRVNLAAGSVEKGSAVMERLQDIARRTYSSLDQTTESYIRNAQTLRDLGRSTQQTLDYTEALNNALVVSGAKADRAASVQDALGKAMAAGKLRGDNLNTVIERGGRVAELLADELGTTVSGLRKFGTEGKITAEIIDRALVGNLEKLREEADSMPATIGDAFQLIANALLQTIGVFDSANEISGTLAESLVAVADAIKDFGPILSEQTTRIKAYVIAAGGLATGWYAVSTAIAIATAGAAAFRTAMIRLGIGAIIIGLGELIHQFLILAERTGGVGNAFELLGRVAEGVWEGIKTSATAIPPALQSVWYEVYAGFIDTMSLMKKEWNDFIAIFEQPAFTAHIGGKSFELIGGLDLSNWKADISNASDAAKDFRDKAVTLREEAKSLAVEGFDKASESLRELQQLMSNQSKGRVNYKPGVDLSGDGGPNRVVPGDDGKGKKSKAEREAERLREIYANLLRDGRAFIEQQQIEQQAIGMTELEAAKLRATFDLLNQAQRAGINLTAAQTEELTNLAHQMAEAEYATAKLQERYDFAKDTFKGFFTDLKSELQNGASVWEAFGTAAANALQKIADKAIDMALNGIFDLIFGAFGGSGGGGGGFLSKIFGHENGTSFAPGGWSVVGERGPELLKLPAGSQVIPNHRVTAPAQASFGGGGMSQQSRMAIDIFVKDDGKIGAIARQEAGDVVEVSIREYDAHQLPKSFERVGNHQRMR